ncbi:Os03g0285501 [Oryza sativa Japonica Group]|uniref:Os03g0285501 protein n=1 Tax=Oryza sativa subsp. japonica TaxID=39947 RepID=A0A0P0VW91_ORYSJ|nr:Os03g0285501 [Oryza sativa Japonica Group]
MEAVALRQAQPSAAFASALSGGPHCQYAPRPCCRRLRSMSSTTASFPPLWSLELEAGEVAMGGDGRGSSWAGEEGRRS